MRLSLRFVSPMAAGLCLLVPCSLTGCGGPAGVAAGAAAAGVAAGAVVFDPIIESGHKPPPTPDPNPPTRPLADYLGTWSGSFSPPPYPPPGSDLRSGTLTLVFSASGVVTGQISDATTGQTGTVGGTLNVSGNTTAGYVDLTFTLAGQSEETTCYTTINGNGVLQGGFLLPAAPDYPDTAPAEYTLHKQ